MISKNDWVIDPQGIQWLVSEVLEKSVFLGHPLSTCEIYVKQDLVAGLQKLDSPPKMSALEKLLKLAKGAVTSLKGNERMDLDALSAYYVLKRRLSRSQYEALHLMVTAIAENSFEHSPAKACDFIKENEALLDDSTVILYNTHKSVIDNWKFIQSRSERSAIFRLAGFLIAQKGGLYGKN